MLKKLSLTCYTSRMFVCLSVCLFYLCSVDSVLALLLLHRTSFAYQAASPCVVIRCGLLLQTQRGLSVCVSLCPGHDLCIILCSFNFHFISVSFDCLFVCLYIQPYCILTLHLLLFLIVIEAISREFRVALPWELLYADDLVVIAETEGDLI